MAEARDRFGTTELPVPSRCLRAGDLSVLLQDGSVRDVRWRGVEILRGVSFLLRDENWGTVPAAVTAVGETLTGDSFDLEFGFVHRHGGARLDTRVRIQGSAQGAFSVSTRSLADRPLPTNRCGLVALHPAHFAGLPVTVLHTDGAVESSAFPGLISPGQPFFAIRELRYAPADGMAVSCRLEAELPHDAQGKFEMEDQRNWSDASFKTYVCSLLDPWPYRLEAGRAWHQELRLQVAMTTQPGLPAAALHAQPGPTLLAVGAPAASRMPALGIGVPAGAEALTAAEVAALRAVAPAWLCAEADLVHPGLDGQLRAVRQLAQDCGARLRLDLVTADHWSAAATAVRAHEACGLAGLRPDALRVLPAALLRSFQPTDGWPDVPASQAYAEALREVFPDARIGGGVFTWFTELNRLDPPADGIDFIGHATSPIVHAADDLSVMETLESLPHIAATVAARWPGLPYQLGPSTLASVRNPYGQAPVANPDWRRVALADRDPRHRAAYGAAWTAGYAAALAGATLELLALHHSHGASGPIASDGRRVPAWNVLQALAAAQGCARQAVTGLPAGVAALAWLRDDGGSAVLLANTACTTLRLRCPPGTQCSLLHTAREAGAPAASAMAAPECLVLAPCDTLLLNVPARPAGG